MCLFPCSASVYPKAFVYFMASMLNQHFHQWKCFCEGLSGEVFLFKVNLFSGETLGSCFWSPI